MVQFRSETMMHGTLVIPSDRAHDFVDLLGRKSNIQIVDMNHTSSNRQYKKYIQRIDEMERILRFLFEEINKLPGASIVTNQVEDFLECQSVYQLDGVEESLQKLYKQFVKFRDYNAHLQEEKVAAIEEKAVAMAATRSLLPEFAGGPGGPGSADVTRQGLLHDDVEQGEADVVGFSNVAGVIPQADQEKFARTIFRATRGNAYTHFETITDRVVDPKTGKETSVLKNVFVIYHQGTMQSAVAERIMRICQAFGVRKYNWPRTHREAETRIAELTEVIQDKSRAHEAGEDYFVGEIDILLKVVRPNGNSLVEEWRLFCLKEKAVYATLNLFEGSDVTLRADCWYPAAQDTEIRQLLMSQANTQQVSAFLLADHRPLPKSTSPPTHFRCPEFTQGFQDFVDTYGVPRYKEANPALTTIVTLPFLFGIMYGDVGHGGCVLLAGIYMVIMWEKKLKYSDSEVLQMVGGGRFMILLMGIFATYSGFLYNDFFALGMDIFGTRYCVKVCDNPANWDDCTCEPISDSFASKNATGIVRNTEQGVYPFGFDPIWKGSENEIDFFNSFKMKFAVIIAFIQMGGGVLHKGSNCIHFSDHLTFFFEFIPQFIFLVGFVGYMDFLIVYKWVTDLSHPKPNIISTIINMFFFKTEDPFWSFQGTLQTVLLILMVACIPIMLFPKPFLLKRKHAKLSKRASAHAYHAPDEIAALKGGGGGGDQAETHSAVAGGGLEGGGIGEDFGGAGGGGAAHEEEFNFGEEFIHQLIETIEFVLGVISNTASYLRLWALSLAHQQLALVFFENTVLIVLNMNINVIALGFLTFFAFGAFAMITLGVMLGMDSLECFLHALRLQWVEFQSKFFKADGYKFEPFSFKKALTARSD